MEKKLLKKYFSFRFENNKKKDQKSPGIYFLKIIDNPDLGLKSGRNHFVIIIALFCSLSIRKISYFDFNSIFRSASNQLLRLQSILAQ